MGYRCYGHQKMSDWPEEIRDYCAKHPDEGIFYTQSQRFEHRISYTMINDKQLLLSYNKKHGFFEAWNVQAKVKASKSKDFVYFDLSKQMKHGARTGSYYLPCGVDSNGNHVYTKVYVFSKSKFKSFYRNYTEYMQPTAED